MLLKTGSKGQDVKTLQQKLGITADGDFGEETKKKVIAFQKANGLEADGVVGDNTWNALMHKAATAVNTTAPDARPPVESAPAVSGPGDFIRLAIQVIENLEGGYYHPAMLDDGRLNASNRAAYGTSGETMFGLDRTAGHELFYATPRTTSNVADDIRQIEANAYKYKNDASAGFWGELDKAGAKKNWKWNYMGGELNGKLKNLAAQIMQPVYDKLATKYIGANRAIVESDPRLQFHFAYASWNGAGWFKKFAADMNAAIAAGKTKPDDLAQVALNSRLNEGLSPGSAPNGLIKQGGEKIRILFGKLSQ
jgi:hypothetical protein